MQLFAKKSLGQHFLHSRHVLEQIISAAHVEKNEVVLEIGPGTGFLTRALLDAGAHVIAVEKDDRAYELLEEKCAKEISEGRLHLIRGDILTLTLSDTSKGSLTQALSDGNYALVANIPYYITGAILEKFLEHEPRPNRMVLLVQKEVATRIMAHDGKESILSISVKAFGTPKVIATVSRGAFTPPPTVDSAILQIKDISGKRFLEKNSAILKFFEMIHAGFAHKRKLLRRNLESVTDSKNISEIWEKASIEDKIRAEDVTLDQWFEICAHL